MNILNNPIYNLSDEDLIDVSEEIDDAFAQGYPLLFFSPKLEKAFGRRTSLAKSKNFLITGFIALIINSLFIFSDYLIVSDVFKQALIVRFGIFFPVSILVIFFIYRGVTPFIRESMYTAMGLFAVIETIYLAVISNEPSAMLYSGGLIIALIFGNIVLRLRFWFAVVFSIITLILFFIFFPYQLPNQMLPKYGDSIMIVASVIFTLLSNYNQEKERRTLFLFALKDSLYNLQLKESNTVLDHLSHVDPLTGAFNRRALDKFLNHLQSNQNYSRIGLAIIDIDYFKRYNDFYGHPAGDTCLQDVAEMIQNNLRYSGDILARYGGEEFVVVLPGIPMQGGKKVAERIRTQIESLAIPHEDSPIANIVTVSIGVAHTEQDFTISDLIQAADSALYRAKTNGRNRVEF